jgi:hypothetical protein
MVYRLAVFRGRIRGMRTGSKLAALVTLALWYSVTGAEPGVNVILAVVVVLTGKDIIVRRRKVDKGSKPDTEMPRTEV